MPEPQVDDSREIVFGETVPLPSGVSIRLSSFPDERTIHWTPKHPRWAERGRGASPEDVSLVVAQEVLIGTSRHVSQSVTRELGGFLLGNRYRCPSGRNYVIIDQFVAAEHTESDSVSLHFTHETWRWLDDHLNTTFVGKALVGWYHSHPRMDVFLSQPDDLSIHERRFPEPWQCALVLEPDKHLGGFFCWRGGQLDTKVPADFYELLRSDLRQTVVAWENYKGVDFSSNVRPSLAPSNTKAAHDPLPVPPPVQPHRRERPWAVMGLAAVACMAAALYFFTRTPGEQKANPDPKPTPTVQVQTQSPEDTPVPPEQTREVPQTNSTATNTQPPADGPREESHGPRNPVPPRRQRVETGEGVSGGGQKPKSRKADQQEPKRPTPPKPKPTPIIN